MSAWGGILDALLDLVEGELSGITVTKLRRYRTPEQLVGASAADMDASDSRAIVLAWVPVAQGVRRSSGRQVERTLGPQLQLWQGFDPTSTTAQETVYLQRDAIAAAIAADPTLGGVVRDAYLESEQTIEYESGAIVCVLNFGVSHEEAE